MPWFDLETYSPAVHAWFGLSALLWLITYVEVLRRGMRDHTLPIPIVAVCLNFGWEVAAMVFWRSHIDMGFFFVVGYGGWLLLDLVIVILLFRHGGDQLASPAARAWFRPAAAAGIVASIAWHCLIIADGYELPMGVITGFAINMVMSVAFCRLAFVPTFRGLSASVAWSKWLGTATASIAFALHYPDHRFLWVLYVGCFVVDGFYVYLVHRRLRGPVRDPHAVAVTA